MRIETDRNCVQWGADPHRGSSKYSPWCEPGGKGGVYSQRGLGDISQQKKNRYREGYRL